MIAGSTYVLRGERVLVLAAYNAKRNPDLPRLQALLPLVRTRPCAPRNVLIQGPGGIQVRPFRGLRTLTE